MKTKVKMYEVIVIGILLASNRVAKAGELLTEEQLKPNFSDLLSGGYIKEAGEEEVEVEETKAGDEFVDETAAAAAAENAGLKIGEVTEETPENTAADAADAAATDAAAVTDTGDAAAADAAATDAEAVVDGVTTNMQFVTAKDFKYEDAKIDELKAFVKPYGVELEGAKRTEVLASFLEWANKETVSK